MRVAAQMKRWLAGKLINPEHARVKVMQRRILMFRLIPYHRAAFDCTPRHAVLR